MAKNTSARKITPADTARILRSVRKQLRLTQIFVSKKLGVSQGSLSKMETAKAEPSAIQWLEFCRMTGIPADVVFRPEFNVRSLKSKPEFKAKASARVKS